MAVKRHSGKDFKFDSWVNVRLSDDDKEALAALAENIDMMTLADWVASLAYQGYSFSLSWDEWSEAQQVSLVCKAPDDPNYGLGLSARHPDFDVALMTLRYKHEAICRAKWSENSPTPSNSWG